MCKYNLCGQYGMVCYISVMRVLLVSFEDYINSVVIYSVPSVVICIMMVYGYSFLLLHVSQYIEVAISAPPRNKGLGCWKS
jgi:hypothetical protein